MGRGWEGISGIVLKMVCGYNTPAAREGSFLGRKKMSWLQEAEQAAAAINNLPELQFPQSLSGLEREERYRDFVERELDPLLTRWEGLEVDQALADVMVFLKRVSDQKGMVTLPVLQDLSLVLPIVAGEGMVVVGKVEDEGLIEGCLSAPFGFSDPPNFIWVAKWPGGPGPAESADESLAEALGGLGINPDVITRPSLSRIIRGNVPIPPPKGYPVAYEGVTLLEITLDHNFLRTSFSGEDKTVCVPSSSLDSALFRTMIDHGLAGSVVKIGEKRTLLKRHTIATQPRLDLLN